jgi:molecular chaperone DnaK (HSP70)
MKWVPYNVVKGSNGKAMISITQDNGKTKLISPEEVSALILGKMKEIAEKYIG